MNDNRADQLKSALRHRASRPVSDAVRLKEMNDVRNYDRRQQQRVFNFERRQANAYTQDTADASPKDVGSSFKLQQYLSKLQTLLVQKSDIFNQLALELPQMNTPQKLRGATGEARGTSNFLSRGEMEGAFSELVSFISSSFGDINLDNRVKDAIYQQFLTPLVAQFRDTATLYPRFFAGIPAGVSPQFRASKMSVKEDAERSYSMFRVMADFIEDGIFRPVGNTEISRRMEEEQVPAMFAAVAAGGPVALPAAVAAAQAALLPPQQPAAPGQNVPPLAPNVPPTREELAIGISPQELARRQAAQPIPPPPVLPPVIPPPQPAPQPALNPGAPPFQPPAPGGPADPLQNLGDGQNQTPERMLVLNSIAREGFQRLPSTGNRGFMTRLGTQIMADPAAAQLGFDGSIRQTAAALNTIYQQNGGNQAGRAIPANFVGYGSPSGGKMRGGDFFNDLIGTVGNIAQTAGHIMPLFGLGQPSGGEDNAEDEGEDQSSYEPQPFIPGDNFDAEKFFTPQPYDPKNPMMAMGKGQPSGGQKLPKGFHMMPDGSVMKDSDMKGGSTLLARMLFPGTSLAYDMATGKNIYTGEGASTSGGCASCDSNKYGGARHRTAPTKRYTIGGQQQGVAQRMADINPDNEIMDAGLMRLKGMGTIDSDMVGRARGIINTPYPEQPYYGYGIDGDEDETTNLTGLKQRLGSGISYGAGRNHRADQMFGYDPVADDVYENTGAEEELAGEGHYREEYEEPVDMDDDPNPFRVRQENYRIATGRQKKPTYNYVK